MATATGTTLKTYFNTGDQPTESNFTDLIDSDLNLTDGGTVAGATTFSKQITGSAGLDGAGTGLMSGFLRQVTTPSADCTLHVSNSGAIVIIAAGIDLKLPTPVAGLNYKIITTANVATTSATVTSTSDGSSAVNLLSGIVETNGSPTSTVDKDVITFIADTATEGDYIELTCVGTGTSAGDPTWHYYAYGDAAGAITVA